VQSYYGAGTDANGATVPLSLHLVIPRGLCLKQWITIVIWHYSWKGKRADDVRRGKLWRAI